MPKKKMKFPDVPGDTPREKFINLARHVLSISGKDIRGKHEQTHTRRSRSRKKA